MTPTDGQPASVERLSMSRGGAMYRSSWIYYTAGALAVVLLAIPIGLLASSPSTAGLVAAVVLLLLWTSLAVYLLVFAARRARSEVEAMPAIEATATDLRMTSPSGEVNAVPRALAVAAVRLTASGIRGSRIQFRDPHGDVVGFWDLTWMAPPTMRWLKARGCKTSWVKGAAAKEAIVRRTAYP